MEGGGDGAQPEDGEGVPREARAAPPPAPPSAAAAAPAAAAALRPAAAEPPLTAAQNYDEETAKDGVKLACRALLEVVEAGGKNIRWPCCAMGGTS